MKDMKIEYRPAADLRPWDLNPKLHDIEALKASVGRYGPRWPILVQKDTMRIIAGHGRLEAYTGLGIDPVPVMLWDCSDEEADAFAIADNQLTIAAGWDEEALTIVIQDMNIEFHDTLGFDSEVLEAYLDINTGEPDLVEDEFSEDVESICKPGDLWILGDHRLLCGDSTNTENMNRLMGRGKADMAFTDPPWNVAIGKDSNPRHRQREGLINDDIGDDFAPFLHNFSKQISTVVKGDVYCVMGCEQWPTIHKALTDAGFHWSATIIWVKDVFVLGRSKYHRRYEPMWYGWHKKGKSSFNNRRDLDDVWEIPRPKRSEEHPTMKPIELVAKALEYSSAHGDSVLDPFGGSGTTMIAAEQLGRKAYLMELDPHYCDVIINRWQELTGEPAVLHGGNG